MRVKSGHVRLNWTVDSVGIWSVSRLPPLSPSLPHQLLCGYFQENKITSGKWAMRHENCGSLLATQPEMQVQATHWFLLPSASPELFWKPQQVPLKHSLIPSLPHLFSKCLLTDEPSVWELGLHCCPNVCLEPKQTRSLWSLYSGGENGNS